MVVDVLTNLPTEVYMLLSAVIGAIVGGLMSMGGNYLFNRRQRDIEESRVRRAIATEIKMVQAEELKNRVNAWVVEGMDQEASSRENEEELPIDLMRQMLPDEHRNDDTEYTREEMEDIFQEMYRVNLFRRLPHYLPSGNVYDQNLVNIGRLSESEIEEVEIFYGLLDAVRDGMDRVVAASTGVGDDKPALREDYQDELHDLALDLQKLAHQKRITLKELGEPESEDKYRRFTIGRRDEKDETSVDTEDTPRSERRETELETEDER